MPTVPVQAQKMRYGRMPLYTPGDAENAKQFASMHAVQRHMVDRGLCRMAYDDNEEEYADFYDFDRQDTAAGGEPDQHGSLSVLECTVSLVLQPGKQTVHHVRRCSSARTSMDWCLLKVTMASGCLLNRKPVLPMTRADAGDWEMVAVDDDDALPSSSGYELTLPGTNGAASRVLGSREFARYYKQKHRAADDRPGVAANSLAAR